MYNNSIDPILTTLGPFQIRWYGVLLGAGVLCAVVILKKLFTEKNYSVELLLDMCVWLIVGGLIGARLGHVFFYNASYFLAHPIEILYIHKGGLASHGMTIGLLLTFFLYTKIKKIPLKQYIDIMIIPIPLIASFIRFANFTNSEIVGRPTDVPWAVLFPLYEQNPVPRHPSQLYESALALAIFCILYFVYKKYGDKLKLYFIFYLFMLLYFSTRFLVEFVKEIHTPFEAGLPLTMGQLLSIPFIVWAGVYFLKIKKQP